MCIGIFKVMETAEHQVQVNLLTFTITIVALLIRLSLTITLIALNLLKTKLTKSCIMYKPIMNIIANTFIGNSSRRRHGLKQRSSNSRSKRYALQGMSVLHVVILRYECFSFRD